MLENGSPPLPPAESHGNAGVQSAGFLQAADFQGEGELMGWAMPAQLSPQTRQMNHSNSPGKEWVRE